MSSMSLLLFGLFTRWTWETLRTAAARRSNTYLVLVSSGRCLESKISYPQAGPV